MAKRILVIDDDLDILEILNLILLEAGFQVVICETGNKADEVQAINPDLIILDVRIAGSTKSGPEICSWIKSQPETEKTPIILLSAE